MANIVKLAFREREAQTVVNLETLEGLEGECLAHGFDASGKPVFKKYVNASIPTVIKEPNQYGGYDITTRDKPAKILNPRIKYWLGGGVCGNADATKFTIEDEDGQTLTGIIGQDVSDQTKNFIDGEGRLTVNSLFFFEQHRVYGMPQPYIDGTDKIIVTPIRPKLNWKPYQALLKKLGSDWRILTKRVKYIIRGLELARLEAEREEL